MIEVLFSVTEAAANAAKRKLENRGTPEACVRVGVKGGGCSGFKYVIQYEDESESEKDSVVESMGVKFLIDSRSLKMLKGTTLDYVKALMFEGFRFLNPREVKECGCGTSFSMKETYGPEKVA